VSIILIFPPRKTNPCAGAQHCIHTHGHTWIFHWLQTKVHLKKNLTRQKWNLKGGVEVHVIFNFYCFYMSLIEKYNNVIVL